MEQRQCDPAAGSGTIARAATSTQRTVDFVFGQARMTRTLCSVLAAATITLALAEALTRCPAASLGMSMVAYQHIDHIITVMLRVA